MQRIVLRAKIHKATVTKADLNYIGSITIDAALMERVDLWPGEKVLVVSNTNGERVETYAIEGERDSGDIFMNVAAAHRIPAGHEIIIMAFAVSEEPVEAKQILVDGSNRFVQDL
jgi:aspartate 1-decarboxylase